MNANTRVRLWKEGIALLPFWVAMAGMMAVPLLLTCRTPLAFAHAAYVFGCALLGSVIIGQEFQQRTMGLLLSQPVSRRRIWWEKMTVLGVALVGLLLWLLILGAIEVEYVREPFDYDPGDLAARREEVRQLRDHFTFGPEGLMGCAALLLPLLLGFGTGPTLTLVARSTIGGVALTFLCPWGLFCLGYLLLPVDFDEAPDLTILTSYFLMAFGVYPGALLLFGCRCFGRWEDRHGQGQELALPGKLATPFVALSRRFTLGQGSALGCLVRKELRLQLPAFVVACGLIALWLVIFAVVCLRPKVDKAFLMLPCVLLGLGIPVITGIVSTAEERRLGLLDWHLTLPVAAGRQWLVKVLVALGINLGLGLLLPGLLTYGAAWWFGTGPVSSGGSDASYAFLIANAVVFSAAMYASSASANSMRALVGTVVIFIAVPITVFPSLSFVGSHARALGDRFQLDLFGGQPTVEAFHKILTGLLWLGGVVLTGWLYRLGLANFRRSIGPVAGPVRRLALLFAVSILYLAALVFADVTVR